MSPLFSSPEIVIGDIYDINEYIPFEKYVDVFKNGKYIFTIKYSDIEYYFIPLSDLRENILNKLLDEQI